MQLLQHLTINSEHCFFALEQDFTENLLLFRAVERVLELWQDHEAPDRTSDQFCCAC